MKQILCLSHEMVFTFSSCSFRSSVTSPVCNHPSSRRSVNYSITSLTDASNLPHVAWRGGMQATHLGVVLAHPSVLEADQERLVELRPVHSRRPQPGELDEQLGGRRHCVRWVGGLFVCSGESRPRRWTNQSINRPFHSRLSGSASSGAKKTCTLGGCVAKASHTVAKRSPPSAHCAPRTGLWMERSGGGGVIE